MAIVIRIHSSNHWLNDNKCPRMFLFSFKNVALRARSEDKGSADKIIAENTGVRIQKSGTPWAYHDIKKRREGNSFLFCLQASEFFF